MIRHIVMWRVRGDGEAERTAGSHRVKEAFEGLRGSIPGLLHVEVGIDTSRIDYACDVVLIREFEDPASLAAYADHSVNVRLKQELGDLRISRHQVDYEP